VGSETPASAAMVESVVFRTASPFGVKSKLIGNAVRLNCTVLAASYANPQAMKMFVTPWKRGVDPAIARPYDDGTPKVFRKLSKMACAQSQETTMRSSRAVAAAPAERLASSRGIQFSLKELLR
jgi:hypothetical protein